MKNLFENALVELRPNSLREYPLHWQRIYSEAICSRHLLFEESDLKHIRSRLTIETPKPQELERVGTTVVELLRASDISQMKLIISKLTISQKEAIFFLYSRAIKQWRQFVKESLN